jgi:predicted transcriptional regulator
LPSDAVETLNELAEQLDRDRSYLLNEVVEQYLERNEYHIKLIEKVCAPQRRAILRPTAK